MNALTGLRARSSSFLDNYGNLVIISMISILAAILFSWQIYATRGFLSLAEKNALMNTLFVCDVVALVIVSIFILLCLYLSSLRYGDIRNMIRFELVAILFLLMVLPVAFIGSEIAFKPQILDEHGVFFASALTALSIICGIISSALVILSLRPRERIRILLRHVLEEQQEAGLSSSACTASMQRPIASGSSLGLFYLLKLLAASGDNESVRFGLDAMTSTALGVKDTLNVKDVSAAGTMVSHIIETGSIGAEAGNRAVVCDAIDHLQRIASTSGLDALSSTAFRGIGCVYSSCVKNGDSFPASVMDPWLAGVYAAVYDATHRRESLDKALTAAERALTLKGSMTQEERVRTLYIAGQINRRIAEIDRSEAKALLAVAQLEDALTCNGLRPIDRAFMHMEIGRSCMALASLKNPSKCYTRALSSFEEAAKVLTDDVALWDAAQLNAYRGDACAMLADEHRNASEYEGALDSARRAIESYTAAAKYFTTSRSPSEHGRIMSNAGLSHTIISEIYMHSRDLGDALKHANMAIDCYSSALTTADRQKQPESYASLKVSLGIAYISIAETCFKEKRYEEAISACDSAIAAYNEALRVYESAGKDKMALPARRHLKQANDLFNTFMMIGTGKGKPAVETA